VFSLPFYILPASKTMTSSQDTNVADFDFSNLEADSAVDLSSDPFAALSSSAESSIASDLYSSLSDALGNKELADELMKTVVKLDAKQRKVFAGFLGRATDVDFSGGFKYVDVQHRGKVVNVSKPMGENATPDALHVAIRLENMKTATEVLARGWAFGQVSGTRQINGGFPIKDEIALRRVFIEDFINRVKYSEKIAGRINPVSAQLHSGMTSGFRNLLKLTNTALASYDPKQLYERDAVKAALVKIAALKKHEVDEFAQAVNEVVTNANQFLHVVNTRLQRVKDALTGRNVRGHDNGAALCGPWYVYPNVPKNLAKFMFLMNITGGCVSTCPPAYENRFQKSPEAPALYVDHGQDFPTIMSIVTASGRAKMSVDGKYYIITNAIVQVDLAGAKSELLPAIIQTINASSFCSSWAIHDGHIFIGPAKKFRPLKDLPVVLSAMTAINNLRTLSIYDVLQHRPIHDDGVKKILDLAYLGTPTEIVLVTGGLTAEGMELDLDFSVEHENKRL